MPTNRVFANTISTFDATNLTGAFQICETGIAEPSFLLKIINTSAEDVQVSYDGVYINDVVLAYSEIVLPFQENKRPQNNINLLRRGTQVWLKLIVNPPKSGDVYVISYYQPVIGI